MQIIAIHGIGIKEIKIIFPVAILSVISYN